MSRRRRTWGLVLAAVLAGVLAGCDGGDAEEAVPQPTDQVTTDDGATSPEQDGDVPDEAAGDLLAGAELPTPADVTAGVVPTIDAEIEVGVVSVTRAGDLTELVWGLRSADGAAHDVDFMSGLNDSFDPQDDVRAVRLVLPDGQVLETAMLWREGFDAGRPLGCLCSGMPEEIDGEWTILTNSYPELPQDVGTVTVQLPGEESYEDGIGIEVTVEE